MKNPDPQGVRMGRWELGRAGKEKGSALRLKKPTLPPPTKAETLINNQRNHQTDTYLSVFRVGGSTYLIIPQACRQPASLLPVGIQEIKQQGRCGFGRPQSPELSGVSKPVEFVEGAVLTPDLSWSAVGSGGQSKPPQPGGQLFTVVGNCAFRCHFLSPRESLNDKEVGLLTDVLFCSQP